MEHSKPKNGAITLVKWHETKCMMPPMDQKVLGCNPTRNGRGGYLLCEFDGYNDVWMEGNEEVDPPEFWMELPKLHSNKNEQVNLALEVITEAVTNEKECVKKVKIVCKKDKYGNKRWYKGELLHRTNGPAIEYKVGHKFWYKNGLKHREGGPAAEYANGKKEWWIGGKKIEVTESMK